MKKTLKLFIGTILALILACSFAACSKKNKDTTDDGNKGPVASCEVIGAGGYGALYDVSIDPFNDNIFAARCDMGGLYMSYDKGENWERHNLLGVFTDIEFDQANDGVIWASGSGLYKSTDHGKTFEMAFPSPDSIKYQGASFENMNHWLFTDIEEYLPANDIDCIAINRKSGGKNVFVSQRGDYKIKDENGEVIKVERRIIIYQTKNGKDFEFFTTTEYFDNVALEYDENYDCLVVATNEKIIHVNGEGKEVWSTNAKIVTAVNNTVSFDSDYDEDSGVTTFAFSAKETGKPHTNTALYVTSDLRSESYNDLITSLNQKKLKEVKRDTPEDDESAPYEYYEWVGGKHVKQSFAWNVDYVHVASADCIYFYSAVDNNTVDASGNQTGAQQYISVFLQYKKGEFKWVYGSPHYYAYDLANTTWQDYASAGCCFGMSTSSKDVDKFAFATIGTVYYTEDGENVYQKHCKVVDEVTLTAKDDKGNQAVFDKTDGCIKLSETTTNGLDVEATHRTVTDPFDSNHLLMACTDFGLIQSFNGGKTWVHSLVSWNNGKLEDMSYYYRNNCFDIEFDREKRGVVYAVWSACHDFPFTASFSALTATGALGISYDGGTSWTMRHIVEDDKVGAYGLDVDYRGEERDIYIATYGRGFFVTHDLGGTFIEMNDGIEPSKYLGADNPAIFANEILSCEDGIYAICGPSAWAFKDRENELYERALYKWNESLKKFVEIPLPKEVACIRDIEYNEKDGCLYIGAIGRVRWQNDKKIGGGVYRYKDGEVTQIFDESKFIWGLDFDSQGNLYATEYRGSVYRFTENNTKAELVIGGLFHLLKDLNFGATDKILYVSTCGGGMYRLILN